MNADTTRRMDMISDRLIELGMTHWLPVLHQWLRQYRGLEEHIDCQEDWPENLVIECLDTYLASNTRPASDAELGEALSRLDFLTWWVRHEDDEHPGFDGWFHKRQDDWTRETGLSRRELESSRQRLRVLGLIEERRAGAPPVLLCRVDFARLGELMNRQAQANWAQILPAA